MPLPGIQQFLQTQQAVQHSVPSVQAQPVTEAVRATSALVGANNPFLINSFGKQGTSSGKSRNEVGVNEPLMRPMFLGYRDNKALYGGDRLFVLA